MEKLMKNQNGKMENNGNVNGIERWKIEMRKWQKGLWKLLSVLGYSIDTIWLGCPKLFKDKWK